MRIALVLLATLAVAVCSDTEETTITSTSTTTSTPESTTVEVSAEESTKKKRTIGQSLGYGYNDISDGRAFYSQPAAATQQQYQTVRYYPEQARQYQQEIPQHNQAKSQPHQHSVLSNAVLSQHGHLQTPVQHPSLLGAGQHAPYLGATQHNSLLGAAHQNHLLDAVHSNPLLPIPHGGNPFLSSGGAPFLFQQPSQHSFLQQPQLFGGPQVIPVIILRVSDPAQHGLVTPALIQSSYPGHQPLQNMLLHYLQQTPTTYYPEHHQMGTQSTKPLYFQQQALVTPSPDKKQLLSATAAATLKPRKPSVSIEQAQNVDNAFVQYSKYSQFKDKL